MAKILVTPRSITSQGHSALSALTNAGYEIILATPGQQPSENELIERLPGCVGMLAGVEKISARALAAATELQVISRNGVGIDGIDLAAAESRGIRVCRAEGSNARGVAELAIGLLLSLARAIPSGDRAIKSDQWERRQGIELEGKTLGIVGCGRIGRLVCEFALALDMRVLAYDVVPDSTYAPSDRFSFVSLDHLFENADAITLHCPASVEDEALLDCAALSKLKHGVFLINTARPNLIDIDALISKLDNAEVRAAAVDVFEIEPPIGDRLAKHPRVIATPHIGGFTHESIDRAVQMAVDNLLETLCPVVQ
ncbi:phosphoglycerate dehydrogenase [Bythopirellula polymerisocia]|uniref:D-3-phosphoglycerate dehydrogenase n=1 Tax=Bythopirellula polymerisocia TaxID=2528003 RepID=A0A5C6C9I2_9BACT|nr:phosphoglycerate dehydrogenase [Bythopirellula polymerisocia]TWU21383.1 D-3-phosphoglycerate dehydrogenase [Bythopirellula polymerisocia]